MTVHIGPYAFDDVEYYAEGDVLYLSIGAPQPAADYDDTLEGHVLRLDERDHVIGLTIVGARELLEEDGGISVTFSRESFAADARELAAVLAA
jgi:uncharacterized protein YuzE